MPVPVVDRVIYEENPLDNVVCQARFPSILKIDTEVPSAFQQKLLPQYINLTEGQELLLDVQMGSKPGIAGDEMKQASTPATKNYEFATDDNRWKINLTRNFFSLSTANYVRWEEFRERFEAALQAFVNVYNPVVFTRIGLRYVDLIVRSKLDLNDANWDELIAQPLLGVLASDDIREAVKQFQSTFLIELGEDDGVARVSAGTVKSAHSGEICFVIDSDYYDLKKRKADELLTRLDYFHSKAFALFRWCITERLHNAMKPNKIDESVKKDD